MKRSLSVLTVFLVLCALLLAGCGVAQDATKGAGAQAPYTETELPLLAATKDAPDKLAVRFYDDAPSVPYIGLARYMSLVFGDEATVEVADGVATITATDGGTAVIDDVADTITSDSWSTFHNYLKPMQQGKMQGFVDFATPFCRVGSLDYEKQEKPLTFDFSQYSINLHVDAEDAYLPLATASDLMADVGLNNLAYNGRELCLLSGLGVSPLTLDSAWYEPIAADEPRAQDMVDYTYGELCFVFDNLYSCSGKGILDESIAAKGLDASLQETDELTQHVRELIRSTDKAEYFAGLSALGTYVMNLHVFLNDADLYAALGEDLSARFEATNEEFNTAIAKKDYANKLSEIRPILLKEAAGYRAQVWSDETSYHEQGDTAVISVDSFMDYDREGWEAYYAGTGDRPDGSSTPDTIGTLLTGLEKAKSNPAIRNVVIDVSINGGGSNDLCITAAALITGKSQGPMRDLATGLRYSIDYEVDSLFDGSFDASAAASGYDFNYAVLTSRGSFSCGNYLPSLLRDAGIPVMGEVSGGGTDTVLRTVTPDGQCLQMTNGFAELVDGKGNQIERGVPLDVDLVTVRADGSKDYSALYDLGRLSEVMHELYPDQALPAAA